MKNEKKVWLSPYQVSCPKCRGAIKNYHITSTLIHSHCISCQEDFEVEQNIKGLWEIKYALER